MKSASKQIGWVVAFAAAASLCFAVMEGREPRRSPPSEPEDALERHRSHLPRRSVANSRHEHCSVPSAPTGIAALMAVPILQRSVRIPVWLAALSVVGVILLGAFCTIAFIKSSAAPTESERRSSTTVSAAVPRETGDPALEMARVTGPNLTATGGGFSLTLSNSGASSAFNVRLRDTVRIEDADGPIEAPSSDESSPLDLGTLEPASALTTNAAFRTSTANVLALREGKVRAVNFATVTYSDQLHRPHTSQYCFYWSAGLPSPIACGGGN